VIVTVLNVGPQDANVDGLVLRLILVGLLTLVFRVIGPVTPGAHLNESPALPKLLVPPLPENVMPRGFVDQRAFGLVLEAKPTAAYAPTIMRLIDRPTRR
jgi:hypothetical protein